MKNLMCVLYRPYEKDVNNVQKHIVMLTMVTTKKLILEGLCAFLFAHIPLWRDVY